MDKLEIANIDIIMNPYQSGELVALLAEFKLTINNYLEELFNSTVRSLSDIIVFDSNNPVLVNDYWPCIFANFTAFTVAGLI